MRQLFENLLLVLLVEAFEQFDGVVGFQFADAFRDRLGFEFFEDFLADGVIDFVQRREVEVGAREFHQAGPLLRIERLDQVAEVGLMQFGHDFAQKWRIGGLNRGRDFYRRIRGGCRRLHPASGDGPARIRRPAGWATSTSSAMPRLAGLLQVYA